jgi:hypothetical protein
MPDDNDVLFQEAGSDKVEITRQRIDDRGRERGYRPFSRPPR